MLKIDARNPKESAKDYVVRQLVYNIIHINLNLTYMFFLKFSYF
mgnify:CR=1 FL=1